jgi:hypothetical protein
MALVEEASVVVVLVANTPEAEGPAQAAQALEQAAAEAELASGCGATLHLGRGHRIGRRFIPDELADR